MASRKKATSKPSSTARTSKADVGSGAESAATVQTTTGTSEGVVRVPAGGIDPRLVEAREAQKLLERDVRPAVSEPARLDPKLAEIRDRTKKREAELANRSLTKVPERA